MKAKKSIIFTLALIMCLSLLAGCKGKETSSGSQSQPDSKSEAQFTVSFFDGNDGSELKNEKVSKGEPVPDYTPEKAGSTFMGWFMTPSLVHKLAPDTKVDGDLSLYAGFVSYENDSRDFYIVGNGTSPLMLSSSWGASTGDGHKLEKQAAEGKNIYTITLDFAAGDEWQLAIDGEWHNQRGWGYMAEPSLDGSDYFAGSGSLGEASAKKSNIKVLVPGNYTITLETFPAEDWYDEKSEYYADNPEGQNYSNYDSITWVRNGDAVEQAAEIVTSYFIKGSAVTGWEDRYDDEYRFTEENGIHSLTIDLEEGDEFLFTSLVNAGGEDSVGSEYVRFTNIDPADSDSLSFVSEGGGANLVANTKASYTFTYNPETQKLTVSAK